MTLGFKDQLLTKMEQFLACSTVSQRDHLGDSDVDGRIILRRIFRKQDVGVWTGSSWLRIGTGGGHL